MRKKRVLFVGSFKNSAQDGSVGGQMYACKALINSELSSAIEWLLLDTTGRSVPIPPRIYRGCYAVIRVVKFTLLILFKRPSSVLIFTGSGASFYEKGLMCVIGKIFFRRIIISPRGGGLVTEVRTRKIFSLYVGCVLMTADYVISQGIFWRDFYSSILPKTHRSKILTIPNWINFNDYKPVNAILNYKLSNSISIVSMGWMEKEKGVQDLFDALLRVNAGLVKIKMYFLGGGTLRNDLINKSAINIATGKVEFYFPGWVYGNDKLEYLHNADIFVLSSYFEGMPNSLIEAMATRNACISTNVGAVSDLIEDKKNGLLYNPGNINQLINALQILIDSAELRNKYADEALKTIKEKNSLDSAVKVFRNIL